MTMPMYRSRDPRDPSNLVANLRIPADLQRLICATKAHQTGQTVAPAANSAEALQMLNEFKQQLVMNLRASNKRNLNEEDFRQAIFTTLSLQAGAKANVDRLISEAAARFEGQQEMLEVTDKLRTMQEENRRLRRKQDAQEDERKQSEDNIGGPPPDAGTSLSHTLNNKVSFDPDMALMSAVVEIVVLCTLETLAYFAREYRNKNPESLMDLLNVGMGTLSSVADRLNKIVLGPGEQQSDNSATAGAAYAAAAAAPKPAKGP